MTIVVVGGGQAGFQSVASLRDGGYDGELVLVTNGSLPYQRPPLSKAFLHTPMAMEQLHYRPQDFYDRHAIRVSAGRVATIDRPDQTVHLESGDRIPYTHVVLATGCRVRRLGVPGEELDGVHYLRDHGDAERLLEHLRRARDVVVIGGGFIGLEVAAGARKRGAEVTVLEAGAQVMGRAVSTVTGDYFLASHRSAGTRILLGTGARLVRDDGNGQVAGVVTTRDEQIRADLVVVGVGVQPNTELAETAGLTVRDGVVVDDYLRSVDDEAVSAVGDCSRFRDFATGRSVRLESVQNAVDQARCVASRLTGRPVPYRAVPWFWTDQLGLKLQIAGLTTGYDHLEVTGDPAGGSYSVYCFLDDRLLGVESVNRASDHLSARRLLGAETPQLAALTPATVAAPDFALRSFLADQSAAISS